MYIIGLTGNIASGKSTVRRMLEGLGARAVDADVVAHDILRPGTQAWREVVETFDKGILSEDGTIDRKRLGAIVFADPDKLKTLEAITHPAIERELLTTLRQIQEEIVVIEAVKLLEGGLGPMCDSIWVVTTSAAEAERRLMHERGLSAEQARTRLAAQPPLAAELARADVVIDNSGRIEETREQVRRAFAAIDPLSAKERIF